MLLTVLALQTTVAPPASAAPAMRQPQTFTGPGLESLTPEAVREWAGAVVAGQDAAVLEMLDPAAGALVPADGAAPMIRWRDSEANTWRVTLSTGGQPLCVGITDQPQWVPDQKLWKDIRRAAGQERIDVAVSGLGGWTMRQGVSFAGTYFAISPDPVQAPLAFIRKPLPFRKAMDNPYDGQMVVGDLSSFAAPRIVLQDQPICFNCHTFSGDGSYGMDMDYKGDKGGYLLKTAEANMLVADSDIVSWNALQPPQPAKYSMGLFTLLSPDGRWAASTVGECSAFVMLDDLHFSQMFFPATGRIGLLDRQSGAVRTLAGANLPEFSQTTPAFSPNGETLAFARAAVQPELVQAIQDGKLRNEDPKQSIQDVNARYPVRFDLYQVPLNDGQGGAATPLPGASDNGASNFFPRYSPDGKWLVFTRAATGLVLQPDSELWIIPAAGGTARRLAANTRLMNSWHCWSPNSRWLAFASKGNSPYTEIYLTHIDDAGNASPALRLFRLSSETMAAMVPEFLPPGTQVPAKMDLKDPDVAIGVSMATDGR